MAASIASNKPIYFGNTTFSLSKKILSTAAASATIVALPHINSTLPVGQVSKPSQIRASENIRTRTLTLTLDEQYKAIINIDIDDGHFSVQNVSSVSKTALDEKGFEDMSIIQASDLLNKQKTLEKSANWVGLLFGAMLVGMLITWIQASFGYAAFFIPPILAAFGVLWAHGIQLNKIDELKKG